MSRVPDRVLGNYLLRSMIGKGGTSEVYAAEHQLHGTPVAIKLLREELAEDDATAAALIEEAMRTRDIVHPAIIRVHDVGRDPESGRCYLVMDHVEGESLAARLRDRGPLPEATVHELAVTLADAMQAAHARGVVHRDLKPGNIMMRGDAPTIIDFGISKYLGGQASAVTNRRIGTLAYMAPEQLAGGVISPAVDVWALGVILFEAVTGRLPYDNFADGRWAQLFDDLPRASSLAPVSPRFERILERCLAREVVDRYPSMAALAADLRGTSEERVTAPVADPPMLPPTMLSPVMPPVVPMPVMSPPTKRRSWFAIGSVALVVILGGLAGAALLDNEDAPAPAKAPARADEPVATDTDKRVDEPVDDERTVHDDIEIDPLPAPLPSLRSEPPEPIRTSPTRTSPRTSRKRTNATRPAPVAPPRTAPVTPARTPPRETLD